MVQGPRTPLKPLKTRSKTYGMLDQLTGQACLTTSKATGTGLKKKIFRFEVTEPPKKLKSHLSNLRKWLRIRFQLGARVVDSQRILKKPTYATTIVQYSPQ